MKVNCQTTVQLESIVISWHFELLIYTANVLPVGTYMNKLSKEPLQFHI